MSLKEFASQDDSLTASIQLTLGSAGLTEFPLGEQEILGGHLHVTAQAWVWAYQQEQRALMAQAAHSGSPRHERRTGSSGS